MIAKHKHKPVRKQKARRVSSKELSHQIDDLRSEMGKMLSELVITRDRLNAMKADIFATEKKHHDMIEYDVRALTREMQRITKFLDEIEAEKNAQKQTVIKAPPVEEHHEAQAQS